MQSFKFSLVLLFAGCSTDKSTIPPPEEAVPYYPTSPIYSLTVEPIRFVADMPAFLQQQLCLKMGIGSSTEDYTRRMMACDGVRMCYLVPQRDKDDPPLLEYILTGERNPPGFGSAELTAQFLSALSQVPNFKVIPPSNISKRTLTKHTASTHTTVENNYVVRGLLTEYVARAEGSQSGLNTSGLGIGLLTLPFSGEATTKTGYVRLDLRVTDPRTNRIITAFPVIGTFSDSFTSQTFFGGVIGESEHFVSNIMTQATRAALNEGASKLLTELNALGEH